MHCISRKLVWSCKTFSVSDKAQTFRIDGLAALLHGCETQPGLYSGTVCPEVLQIKCLQFLCGVTWQDMHTNVNTRHLCIRQSLGSLSRVDALGCMATQHPKQVACTLLLLYSFVILVVQSVTKPILCVALEGPTFNLC